MTKGGISVLLSEIQQYTAVYSCTPYQKSITGQTPSVIFFAFVTSTSSHGQAEILTGKN